MLQSIKISNIALISKSNVEFGDGFNALTGETGAGKSLIVDALLFLTGVRADKTLIKEGEDCARVEGVFTDIGYNPNLNDILRSVDIENEGTIIISRLFSISGKNECRINGEVVTLNILRKVASFLIDIFGQNDSQILLDSTKHITVLDEMFADDLTDTKSELENNLVRLKNINDQIRELGGLDTDRENNIRLMSFEIDEINNANLYVGLEEELKGKLEIMQNSEKIFSGLAGTLDILDGEYPLSNAIKTAINSLNSVEKFDNAISCERDRLQSIKYEMDDIISNISSIQKSIDYSQDDIDKIIDRLSDIKDLERKYGSTIEEILNTKRKLEEKLDILLNSDEKLTKLKESKICLLQKIYGNSTTLRKIRQEKFITLKDKMQSELKLLGMKNARFELRFNNEISLESIEREVTPSGADDLEFLFSANLGVEPRPLSKIISGGEMSRFMLALKSLQSADNHKTCIFDEIDTGIGGEIGGIVGQKISDISYNNQVICITHLAQIAVFGDRNYKIEKTEDDVSTQTNVKLLDNNDKVIEIARMLGSSTDDSSIMHAKGMIDKAKEYKSNIHILP